MWSAVCRQQRTHRRLNTATSASAVASRGWMRSHSCRPDRSSTQDVWQLLAQDRHGQELDRAHAPLCAEKANAGYCWERSCASAVTRTPQS
jgi:hypothetical protein